MLNIKEICVSDDTNEFKKLFQQKRGINKDTIFQEALGICFEHRKWKQLSVLFDHQIFYSYFSTDSAELIEGLNKTANALSESSNFQLVDEKAAELCRLLISFNILTRWVMTFKVKKTDDHSNYEYNISSKHPNCHLFFCAGFSIDDQIFKEVRRAFSVSIVKSLLNPKYKEPTAFEIAEYRYDDVSKMTLIKLVNALNDNVGSCMELFKIVYAVTCLSKSVPIEKFNALMQELKRYYEDHPDRIPKPDQFTLKLEAKCTKVGGLLLDS